MGLHYLITAAIATGIRGCVVASAVDTAMRHPFTFPSIWISNYNRGSLVLGAGMPSEVNQVLLSSITWSSASDVWPWEENAPIVLPMTGGGVMLSISQ